MDATATARWLLLGFVPVLGACPPTAPLCGDERGCIVAGDVAWPDDATGAADVTGPPRDVTEPPRDVTEPPRDVLEPPQDVTVRPDVWVPDATLGDVRVVDATLDATLQDATLDATIHDATLGDADAHAPADTAVPPDTGPADTGPDGGADAGADAEAEAGTVEDVGTVDPGDLYFVSGGYYWVANHFGDVRRIRLSPPGTQETVASLSRVSRLAWSPAETALYAAIDVGADFTPDVRIFRIPLSQLPVTGASLITVGANGVRNLTVNDTRVFWVTNGVQAGIYGALLSGMSLRILVDPVANYGYAGGEIFFFADATRLHWLQQPPGAATQLAWYATPVNEAAPAGPIPAEWTASAFATDQATQTATHLYWSAVDGVHVLNKSSGLHDVVIRQSSSLGPGYISQCLAASATHLYAQRSITTPSANGNIVRIALPTAGDGTVESVVPVDFNTPVRGCVVSQGSLYFLQGSRLARARLP